ncbi:hypothetical protein R3I93_011604 [Phoxinus phoxinus]|uniref:Uncharacterized protein n=1 Tax=Phoxinus phoxinus TaxID=58324 RepID=A0AAN9CWF8_9TELE
MSRHQRKRLYFSQVIEEHYIISSLLEWNTFRAAGCRPDPFAEAGWSTAGLSGFFEGLKEKPPTDLISRGTESLVDGWA